MCKILAAQAIKPHKVRYCLELRDPEFETKMAQILCIYKEAEILKGGRRRAAEPSERQAIVYYDENPGAQATGATAPDLPPRLCVHAAFARDHEYKCHAR